jgi:hypothetical protein
VLESLYLPITGIFVLTRAPLYFKGGYNHVDSCLESMEDDTIALSPSNATGTGQPAS